MTTAPQSLPEGFVIDEEPPAVDFSDLIPPGPPRDDQPDVPWATPAPPPAPQGPGLLDALRSALTGVIGIPAAEARVRGGSASQPAPGEQQPPPAAPPEAAPQPAQPQAQPSREDERPVGFAFQPWRDEDPDDIWEIEAEQETAREIYREAEGLPARAAPNRQEPGAALHAPEAPSAEPVEDLIAQSRDLADTGNRRQALFLSNASREALRANPAAEATLTKEFERQGIDADQHGINDFDGQGGLLIVPDARQRERAEQRIDQGEPVDRIIGTLIGAGRGKPSPVLPDGTPAPLRVVQQTTPAGAVSLERWVATSEDAEAGLRDLAMPGRSVRVVSPEEVAQRRTRLAPSPVEDAMRQARELADPASQRRALWLPGTTLDALADNMGVAESLAAEIERLGIGPESRFDAEGGVLVVPDPEYRAQAQQLLAQGIPPQQIAGALQGTVRPSTAAAGEGRAYAFGRAERFTPAFRKRMPEAAAAVERELRRMLPQSVALHVVPEIRRRSGYEADNIAAMFETFPDIVTVGLMDGPEAAKVKGFHEVAAHALRGGTMSLYRSLYTAEEWKLLVAKAKEVNAEASLPSPIPGVRPIEAYRRVYTRQAQENGYRGAELRAYVMEVLDQERVGALAEQWADGTDFGAKVNSLLERILKFLEAIRNAIRGLGFQTAEDVLQRVVAGEIAERGDRRTKEKDERVKRSAAEKLDKLSPETKARAHKAVEERIANERAANERAANERAARQRAEAQLPDVDSMDTFELRHLAKDLGLADNLWRGRHAPQIRKAIKEQYGLGSAGAGGLLNAVRGPTETPPRKGTPAAPSQAPPPAAGGGGAGSGGGSGGIPRGGGRGSTPGGGPPPAGPERRSLLLSLIPSAPLDRVMRIPFDIFGGTDEYGRWRPGIYLSDKAARLITSAEFSDSGRFAWVNPVLHRARSGLVDRYGLDPAYVERDRQRALDERRIAAAVPELMATLRDRNIGPAEAKVLHDVLTGEAVADADMARLAEPIRNAVDQMGQLAVDLGLISAESYERNRGTYLHRVYLKHETDQGGLTRLVSSIMGSRRKKLLGEELKGRGLWITASPGALARLTPEAQAARKASAEVRRLERRKQDLKMRRLEAEAAAGEQTAESQAHFRRRLDVADAATIGTQAADVRRPTSFQKGQAREQGVALDRLLDKRRRATALIAKIDATIAEVDARIADAEARLPGAIVAQKGDKFIVLDRPDTEEGADLTLGEAEERDTTRRRRGHRVYVRQGAPIPEKYVDYLHRGLWQVRGTKGGKVILWRDFTKAERTAMGEITDARYTIAKTFMLMAHDLAVGRFYRDIAENPDWAAAEEPEGKWVNAGEYKYRGLSDDRDLEWVRVPDTTIPKSATKRYGALAGKWVRAEIWRDIAELERMQTSGWWNDLLTVWKVNKTGRSPVVHMNNVVSNAVLMDMADIRARDLARGIRSLAKGDALYREAAEAGAFGADMVAQEIRRDVLEPILEEIEKGVTSGRGPLETVIGGYGRLADAIWSRAKSLDRKMVRLYQLEDEVFRMATFIRRREQGMDARTAAIEAKDQFLDYDIRAPWVNTARRTVLPFISYTYRAVPIIAKTVATRPWKLAKYATVAYALNALAYALLPGDEDEERRSMREELEGYTWIGAPRMLRTPFADGYGNPIFLDIRRWIPAGDVFDLNQSHAAVPLPSWLSLGGPLLMGAELALNKQSFTGREIINERTADWWDRTSAVSDYLWKSWMPSAAWVPGSWYWQSVGTAVNSRLQSPVLSALGWGTEPRDRQGNLLNPATAALSSVGIKVKPQDVQEGFWLWGLEFQRVERDLRAEARRIGRDRARGVISEGQMERQLARITEKLGRLERDATRRFEGERRSQQAPVGFSDLVPPQAPSTSGGRQGTPPWMPER